MKKKKRMYCFSALIALCPFLNAQSRLEIRGTDTSAVIPIQQLRVANAKFVELKHCQEEQDSLESKLRTYTGMVNNLRASITDLKEANRLGEAALGVKQKALDLSEDQLQASKKKVSNLRWQRNSIAGICAVILIKFLVFK